MGGKSKKAFSHNVEVEMEHGKPQKQALAIAYSKMRESGHKMSKGGMCEKCDGSCKYAMGYSDGGDIKAPPPPPPNLSAEKGQQISNSFKSAFAEGGEIDEMPEDHEMMDGVCQELCDALESKDKKAILESLKALIYSLKG